MKASKFQSLTQDWDNLGLQDLINVQVPEQEVSTIEFALLAKIQQKCLNEAGCLDLQFSAQLPEQTLQQIQSNLTLAGFIELSYDQSSSTIKCKKPNFPKGKSVKEISQWKEAAQNFEKGEVSEFINEENLLQEEEKNVLFQKFQDCMSKPKPCANCTCGRKEQYEQDMQALQQTNQPPVKSNCGKCALGDAFRCEGCPYRGMPAFNPGEEPELPTSVSQKGKVTIQL